MVSGWNRVINNRGINQLLEGYFKSPCILFSPQPFLWYFITVLCSVKIVIKTMNVFHCKTEPPVDLLKALLCKL